MIGPQALPVICMVVILLAIIPSSLALLPRVHNGQINLLRDRINQDKSKRSAGSHCEDVGAAEECAWWNEQGYCADDSDFHEAMLEQCAKTCGCEKLEEKEEEEEIEEVVVVMKRGCENKGSPEDCEFWKGEGYCADDSEFHDAIMEQCPCSCEGEEVVEEVAEEVLVVKRGCENTGSPEDCEWWESEGYCADDSEFHDAMMTQCPCSCEGKEAEAVLKRSAEDVVQLELEERCEDSVEYCNVLQQQGACDDNGGKLGLASELVAKAKNILCRKTCGNC